MADISYLARLINGIPRNVDVSTNSLVVGSLKIDSSELTKAILDKLIAINSGSFFSGDITVNGTGVTTIANGAVTNDKLAGGIAISKVEGLQESLNSKANDSDVVHLAGTETITGVKSFGAGLKTDTVDEHNSNAGVTVDGVLIKDGLVDNVDVSAFKDAYDVHNHDARYYTESEVDAALLGKSDVGHGHNISDVSGLQIALDSKLSLSGGTMGGNISMDGLYKITSLAGPTNALDAATKGYVDQLTAGFNPTDDINDNVVDASLVSPANGLPAAQLGDRYILQSGTDTLHAGWGTINGVGDNDIVEFDGTDWFVAFDSSADTRKDALVWSDTDESFFKWSGTHWIEFGGLSGVTAGVGLEKTGNTISVVLGAGIKDLPTGEVGIDLATDGGLELTSELTGGQLKAKFDDSTIGSGASGLFVKNGGITATQINSSAIGNGLSGGNGTAISVKNDTVGGSNLARVVNINSEGVSIKIDDITIGENVSEQLFVKNNSINENKLTTSVAGQGLQGGNGSALSVKQDTTGGSNLAKAINVSANGVAVKVDDSTIEGDSTTGNLKIKDGGVTETQITSTSLATNGSLQGGSGTKLSVKLEGTSLSSTSNGLSVVSAPSSVFSATAGQTFTANTTYAVRLGINEESEIAGRIYSADTQAGAIAAPKYLYYVIGVVKTSVTANSGDIVDIKTSGVHTLDAAQAFNTSDIGKPIYLGSNGSFTITAPTAQDTAVVRFGIVLNTTQILIQPMQINGIN